MSSAAVRLPVTPPVPERPDLDAIRARGLEALRRIRESGALDDLTDEEIQAEIDAYRAERRERERRGG